MELEFNFVGEPKKFMGKELITFVNTGDTFIFGCLGYNGVYQYNRKNHTLVKYSKEKAKVVHAKLEVLRAELDTVTGSEPIAFTAS
jgi:hypothetical protein